MTQSWPAPSSAMTADGTERKEFAVGTSGGITSGFVGIRDGDGLVRLGGSLLSLSKGTVGPDVRPPRPSGTVRYLSVFAFCLMDYGSRNLVRQRFGANRKKIAMTAAIRAQGVRQEVVSGDVIEDWDLSGLLMGQCMASLPVGQPFFFAFKKYSPDGA
jgi:hypothetical protein